jgi:hypothetical protein
MFWWDTTKHGRTLEQNVGEKSLSYKIEADMRANIAADTSVRYKGIEAIQSSFFHTVAHGEIEATRTRKESSS